MKRPTERGDLSLFMKKFYVYITNGIGDHIIKMDLWLMPYL